MPLRYLQEIFYKPDIQKGVRLGLRANHLRSRFNATTLLPNNSLTCLPFDEGLLHLETTIIEIAYQ